MDFFSINFGELFLNKHGKNVFEDFSKQISTEKGTDCTDEYINIVFRLAFLSFFGFDNEQIQKLLNDRNISVNVEEIMAVQSKSINLIKEFLENNVKNNSL